MTRRVIALIALITLGFVLIGPARAAGTSDANRFFALANQSRADAGLPAYANADDLAQVALGQAQRMAEQHGIFHNSNLASEVANWRIVGENVGVGATADSVNNAFMQSPNHRANILSGDFVEMGVGTVIGDDGRLYVSEVFRLPYGAASAEPVAVAAPEAPAPEAPADAPEPAPAPEAAPAPAVAPGVTASAAPLVAVPGTTPAALSAPAGNVTPASHPQAAAAVHPAAPAQSSNVGLAMWLAAVLALVVLGLNAVVLKSRLQGPRVVAPHMA